mgnify:CR=1 FL=1
MTVCIASRPSKRIGSVRSYGTGFSGESQALDKKFEALWEHESETISLGWKRALKDRLWDTFDRCSAEGWDGADAESISLEACQGAEKFIDLLPDEIIAPEVIAEADGQIALDWQKSRDCILSIGFEGANINFAGYFGETRRVRGKEVIDDEIPEAISSILKAHFSAA